MFPKFHSFYLDFVLCEMCPIYNMKTTRLLPCTHNLLNFLSFIVTLGLLSLQFSDTYRKLKQGGLIWGQITLNLKLKCFRFVHFVVQYLQHTNTVLF